MSCDCNKPTVICCGAHVAESSATATPTETSTSTETQTSEEPTPPPCNGILKVTFQSVKVTKDGGFGDADWRLDFIVNGEVRSLDRDVNEDDPPYSLGYDFIVDVSTPGSNLIVEVGGEEFDWNNESLPGDTDLWSSYNNFGIGTHTLYAGDGERSYEVTYRIECSQSRLVAISKSQLVNRAEAVWKMRNERRKDRKKPILEFSEPEYLSQCINRLTTKGLQFKQQQNDILYFEGHVSESTQKALSGPIVRDPIVKQEKT